MNVNDNSKYKSIIMTSVFCFTEINYLCPRVDSCPRDPVPADSEDGVSPRELAKGLDPWVVLPQRALVRSTRALPLMKSA